MKKFITFLILIIPFLNMAQKQGNIWCFAEYSDLNFATGTAVPITNSQISSLGGTGENSEGCSSICDSAGNLLMYASPTSIWDRSDNVMPNGSGLMGGMSSTQGVIIIPKPESCNLFYVFTLDEFQNNLANGLRYSIVDLCLDNGMGDVVSGSKNILLLDSTGEKMAATFHSNGTDIWLVTRKHYTNQFYSFLITTSGISPPVISAIGWSNPQVGIANAIGQMKISPDGSKIAFVVGNQTPYLVQLFHFNDTTGVISNEIDLPTSTNSGNPYGVAFSPDNSKLYIQGPTPTGLNQFDLSSGIPDTIINSLYNVPCSNCGSFGLQLANNGKIYINQAPNIGIINSPNLAGNACNCVSNVIASNAAYTFPSFIDNFKYKNTYSLNNNVCSTTQDTTICNSSSVSLNAINALSYTWSTGSNTQTISVNNSGTYWVQIQTLSGCNLTDTTHVNYTNPSTINLLKDTSICSNTSYTLNASASSATSYTWSTGATSSFIIPSASVVYWVDMLVGQCVVRDSATINVYSSPMLTINNYTVCNGQSVDIIPTVSGGTGTYNYNWGNGYTGASYSTTATSDSVYSVSIKDSLGCSTPVSTGSITVLAPLTVNANGINTCSIDSISLLAMALGGNGNYTYSWTPSNSNKNPLLILPQNNIVYTVTVSDGCTTKNATDTAMVTIINPPIINLPQNLSGCSPVCISLANIPYSTLSSWQWNFGNGDISTAPKTDYCYSKTGNYNLSLTYTTSLGCVRTVTSDSIVQVFPFPVAAFSASTFQTDILNAEIYFINESSGYINSQWFFGDLSVSNLQNPSHNYTSTGNYHVILVVQNQEGCLDTVIHNVLINDVFAFYAPNAFTPNGDGLDDVFLPVGTGWDNSSFKMLIFDRWGNLILSTTNPNQGWDGRVKEQPAQEDVYVWRVELNDVFKKSHSYSGTISLIR